MAERITVARPYAVAAFRSARANDLLQEWSGVLSAARVALETPALVSLLSHPRVPKGRLAEAIIEAIGAEPVKGAANFIEVLAQNDRLGLCPEIADLFEELKRDHERRAEVRIRTAWDLSGLQLDLLSKAMQRRLGRDVNIVAEIDDNLIGGAVISVGDQIIDGSVLGRIEQLRTQIQ